MIVLDENLSTRLVNRLKDLFPDLVHVEVLGMKGKRDSEIWLYGKLHRCVIITTDRDYYDLALKKGAPPKVIWLKRWDYGTSQVEATLRRNAVLIFEFLNSEKPLLVLQRT